MAQARGIRNHLSLDDWFLREVFTLWDIFSTSQVILRHLHLRPIHWHLKNDWDAPESLEKIINLPRSLHLHLKCWLDENNVLHGPPLPPHSTHSATDYRCIKQSLECTLRGLHRRPENLWSKPESNMYINFLEPKAILLALRTFGFLGPDNSRCIRQHNSCVVYTQGREYQISREFANNVFDARIYFPLRYTSLISVCDVIS